MSALSANTNKIYHQMEYITAAVDEDDNDIDTYDDHKLVICAPYSVAHSTGIIFVLPAETFATASGETEDIEDAKLVIRHSVLSTDTSQTTFSIVKQSLNGQTVPITQGDIVANRLALFRINPEDSRQMILINSALSGDVSVNRLICTEAYFYSKPKVVTLEGVEEKLLTVKDNQELIDELDDRYQKRIVSGSVSPDEYLKTHTLNPGQVYIQVKDTK